MSRLQKWLRPALQKLWGFREKLEIGREVAEAVKRIYSYCAASQLQTGVFLVGEAHRKFITEKLKAKPWVDTDSVKWELNLVLMN